MWWKPSNRSVSTELARIASRCRSVAMNYPDGAAPGYCGLLRRLRVCLRESVECVEWRDEPDNRGERYRCNVLSSNLTMG